jgi:hypothetical protein
MITFQDLRNHPTIGVSSLRTDWTALEKNWHTFLERLWAYIYQFDGSAHLQLCRAAQQAIETVMNKDKNYAIGYVLGVIEQTHFNIFGKYPE